MGPVFNVSITKVCVIPYRHNSLKHKETRIFHREAAKETADRKKEATSISQKESINSFLHYS
jgi:hypothetical protein